MVEALIDFGEGEDIEEGVYDQGAHYVQHLAIIVIEGRSFGQPEKKWCFSTVPSKVTLTIIVVVKSCVPAFVWPSSDLPTPERAASLTF
jgi:hypothetical protein